PLCSRVDFYFVFCLMIPLPPGPTLFPYTTLFRSSSLITRYSLLLLDAIHACSGVVHDIAPGFLWEAAERFVNELLRLRPSGSGIDRKSTRLNSSHVSISYAVFCLKKKNNNCYSYD